LIALSTVSELCLYIATGAYAITFIASIAERERIAGFCFWTAFLFHTVSQVSRGWYTGVPTPFAIVEANFFLPWCLAFLTLSLKMLKWSRQVWFGLLPVLLFLALALQYPKGIIPPSPLRQTIFSPLFFLFEVPAQALFILGGLYAARFLRGRNDTFFDSLLVWGFIFYSIAQVVGAIWCYLGWASLFSWSTRHLLSASIWCLYAAYLHLHFLTAWNMKRKAWFAVAGASLVVFVIVLGHVNEMNMPRLGG
jgi:ABC-type transport system involved in cytochrome c biogenesis permease subunit